MGAPELLGEDLRQALHFFDETGDEIALWWSFGLATVEFSLGDSGIRET